MFNIAFKTNSVDDAPKTMSSVPSMEMNVLMDSPSNESIDIKVMTPAVVPSQD